MSLPLHESISEKLSRQILKGDYPCGGQLPSERQLMQAFNVSRITVRRAIANLVARGLVTSHQGKGVFVNERKKVTYSLSSPLIFLERDMERQGIPFAIQNLIFTKIEAPQQVKNCLNLDAQNCQVYLQKKLLIVNNVPGGLDISYILPHLGAAYAEELQHKMTFPTLEERGIFIDRVESVLECTHADRETCDYLEVSLGHPLLVFRYTAYSRDEKPLVCGESISRGDRFCYSLAIERSTLNSDESIAAEK